MLKVDLITGFLGCGKTTFIHHYLQYFKRRNQKVHIIENEFGMLSMDAGLLKDEGYEISDLSGVCMCCKGKPMFRSMLCRAAEDGCDRILVEPSGIYDVDEFFEIMTSQEVAARCEIGSILTIVDARFDEALSDEAQYLMFSQLLAAGTVILSKTQLFPEKTAEKTIDRLNQLMKERGSERRFGADVCRKNWESLTDSDFEAFQESGWNILDHKQKKFSHDAVFETKGLAGYCENQEDLKQRLSRIFTECDTYGMVFRIKGHIRDLEKNWYEINATRDTVSVRPVSVKRGIFMVIGENLDQDALADAFLNLPK